MICPYCGGAMAAGKIYGDRYQMKWMPDDKKLVAGTWVRSDYIPIGTPARIVGRPSAAAHVCLKCKKLIHDIEVY